MVTLHFGGVPLAPEAAFLVASWADAVHAHEDDTLDDLIAVVQRRLFDRGRAIVLQRSGSELRWQLTPWGELTLCELIAVARKPDVPAEIRRLHILTALNNAGYDGKVQTV